MTAETIAPDSFAPIFEYFTAPARTAFSSFLDRLSLDLRADEAALIRTTGEEALKESARLKLSRLLLLELHAAKHAGELTANSDRERFLQFIEHAQQPEFVAHLDQRYPPLRARLERALRQQREAIEALVLRFIADRSVLARLPGQPSGRLIALKLGQGDPHAGGKTVARISLEGGQVMYKPRSLRIDLALETFLENTLPGVERIRVPKVIDRGDYGWVEYVTHRYCDNELELQAFYTRLGHWLAVLRLVGGTDIHLENLIAVGPVPVVIDVESLFAPVPEIRSSKYGHAHDLAESIIRSSVLRTGIVPFRAPALGLNGVDLSAAGALPGQQPQVHAPVIANEGTTAARVEVISVDVTTAQNHPSPNPDVSLYWAHISEGFLTATKQLRKMDSEGELASLLALFEDCQVRDIRRPTQAYMEIGRMLWHPSSLHDEAKAIERARDLFVRNAAVVPIAPSEPLEIASEIDDLRYGDVPIFVAPLARARIDAVLADWRKMRPELEDLAIRSALVVTELNRSIDGSEKLADLRYFARRPHAQLLDARRRKLAADAVERLLRLAVHGADGSVTWITPETSTGGWLVQPLQADTYFGLGGVVVALAGYQYEVARDRAESVTGVDQAIEGALQVLCALDASTKAPNIGGLNGCGGRIWSWLTLYDLLPRPEFLERAIANAKALESDGFEDDRLLDLIDGTSGAIVPLINLAEVTGDARWLALAALAAKHLEETAIVDERGARWPSSVFEHPIGGFAHGAAGIGWSLARLALVAWGDESERARLHTLAKGAFAFQDSMYDSAVGNWLDARQLSRFKSFHTWCNGSVGIGLAACDLYSRTHEPYYLNTLRRAVTASQGQWGASHTLCHGDFSLWELLARASMLDPSTCPVDPVEPIAQIISSIEEHKGIIGGMTRAAFTPGLMTGLAGAIHSLNRMHPDSKLASPLLLERHAQVA